MAYRLLLVDDNETTLTSIQDFLHEHFYEVDIARSGEEAILKFSENPHQYALVIMDFKMPGKNGAEVARDLRALNDDIYILVISGTTSVDDVTASWKAGAVEFFHRKNGPLALLEAVSQWCAKFSQTNQTIQRANSLSENEKLIASVGMVGRSEVLANIAKQIKRYQKTNKPVLLLGETGSGKELIAQAIHNGPQRSFHPIHCATYSDDTALMRSELFGHEQGAFTGATKKEKGLFECANGDTIFLDDIELLSLSAQSKLLRVLQENKIMTVGGKKEVEVSFRLIVSAKRDLEARKERGDFLRDLYRRINVLSIDVPPLRERPEDIEPLILHFTEKWQRETGIKRTFLSQTVAFLTRYTWPENIGELESMVYRLLYDCPGDKVTPQQLDKKFHAFQEKTSSFSLLKIEKETKEREQIVMALKKTASQRQAAHLLGISESYLRKKLLRYNINKDSWRVGVP